MELFTRAVHAFIRARVVDPDFGVVAVPPGVALWRARLVGELAAMLGVDPAQITVTADSRRRHLANAAQLLTLTLDPIHPQPAQRGDQRCPSQRSAASDGDRGESAAPGGAGADGGDADGADADGGESVLRFIPVLGYEGVFAVLGRCTDCGVTEVPVAAIAQLADLGAWLVEGRAPDNGLRHTLGWDLNHEPSCPWTDPQRPAPG